MTKALGLAVVTCAAGAIMVVTASNAYAYECEVLSVGTTAISPPGIPGYLYPDGECGITPPDEAFLRLLTEGKFCGGEYNAPINCVTDFAMVKSHALWVCQLRTNGMDSYRAMQQLEQLYGYDIFKAIPLGSAAHTIYCPWA